VQLRDQRLGVVDSMSVGQLEVGSQGGPRDEKPVVGEHRPQLGGRSTVRTTEGDGETAHGGKFGMNGARAQGQRAGTPRLAAQLRRT
jgi:hypothetical protein